MHACIDLQENPDKWQSIDLEKFKDEKDESGVPQERQSVIRDFSVFLMHVLRVYVKKHGGCESNIPLDERLMEKTYEKVDVDPAKFLAELIRTRLVFDKYVVKAKMLEGEVEGWRLKEIIRYQQNGRNSGSYDAKNTFSGEDAFQAQIIALESALQVSNADQRHKEWLHAILSADESIRRNPQSLITLLHRFVAERIEEAKNRAAEANRPFYQQGLNTPRLVLNVIDYLMWLKSQAAAEDVETVFRVPREFVFKYLNSVEHHHPQHDDQALETWSPKQIDDIGNLFLVYSSENSSMSNREPHEKKHRYTANHDGSLPDNPKRRWMYEHTLDDGTGWNLTDMEKLSRYVQELLEAFLTENTTECETPMDSGCSADLRNRSKMADNDIMTNGVSKENNGTLPQKHPDVCNLKDPVREQFKEQNESISCEQEVCQKKYVVPPLTMTMREFISISHADPGAKWIKDVLRKAQADPTWLGAPMTFERCHRTELNGKLGEKITLGEPVRLTLITGCGRGILNEENRPWGETRQRLFAILRSP